MTRVIWKFSLRVTDEQTIAMSAGAKIQFVDTQHGSVCLWAEVEAPLPTENRIFRIHGTGHNNITDNEVYVGSCQMGQFVWHIYEVKDAAPSA